MGYHHCLFFSVHETAVWDGKNQAKYSLYCPRKLTTESISLRKYAIFLSNYQIYEYLHHEKVPKYTLFGPANLSFMFKMLVYIHFFLFTCLVSESVLSAKGLLHISSPPPLLSRAHTLGYTCSQSTPSAGYLIVQ